MKKLIIAIMAIIIVPNIYAQQDSTETEDFSAYADMAVAPSKVYCTSKVIGISPSKLISVGFDFQAPYVLSVPKDSNGNFSNSNNQNNTGTRIAANFPVISNTRMVLSLGASYLDNKYAFENENTLVDPLAQTLGKNGLRSMGLNYTLFVPLNEEHFLLNQSSFDLNGDYDFSTFQDLKYTRVSTAALFGWKMHDRKQFGIGACRTFRGGNTLYIPVLLYNYTFPNRKWGFECLLPARGAVRYTVNSRNILLGGFELEGNSYHLGMLRRANPNLKYNEIELKRSEIRARLTYEFSLYNFFWLSVQAGYRVNYRFNTVNDNKLLAENKLTNPFYANVSINLVSP
jgi:hypothetical protein